jgi:methylaspartate mutase epsilon subunit
LELKNQKLRKEPFLEERKVVLSSWPTGAAVDSEEAIRYQSSLAESKVFSNALREAEAEGRVLLQPRAGVALVDEQIELLRFLEGGADLLPTTIDAYTRQNKYQEAEKGIQRSQQAGRSLLNGFPAVNHGVKECRRLIGSVSKPVQVRHGTPDARLLAEISLASGFTAFEGGGISYNIPYAKNVPLEKSIRDWQYVDRLVGLYEERGIAINREPFGPLSGTLIPPFLSHTVALIEGLLALEQGVRSISLGYGQAGNLIQDTAAIRSLRELGHEYFREAGFDDYKLTTVFHQWMGGFPENESQAFAVISWGAAVATFAGATKVIVKTPHEAMGIPTKEANLAGLRCTRQMINMLSTQSLPQSAKLEEEIAVIKEEVNTVMEKVRELGSGDWAVGAVRAFEAGVIDIPFAPAVCNNGKLLPIRDNEGFIRLFKPGAVPLSPRVEAFHRERIAERAKAEGREASFQMVIDDIYAISKGRLVGRPR